MLVLCQHAFDVLVLRCMVIVRAAIVALKPIEMYRYAITCALESTRTLSLASQQKCSNALLICVHTTTAAARTVKL
jgi:hypothetical protein